MFASMRVPDTSTDVHSLIRELVEAVKKTVLFVSYDVITGHRTYHRAGNLSNVSSIRTDIHSLIRELVEAVKNSPVCIP